MSDALPRRVLHVINYGWPYIDGYTVRGSGLISAQETHLGIETSVLSSPFVPLAAARDPDFATPSWRAERQLTTPAAALRRYERPGLGLAPFSGRLFRRRLDDAIERLRPELIHAHHPHYVGAAALTAARARGLPFVYELRCFNGDYDLDRPGRYQRLRGAYQNRRELSLCRRAGTVVTIADGLARRIEAGGVAPERIFVVRNSVDGGRFDTPNRFSDAAARPVDGELRIGYATKFDPVENLDLLLDAAAAARAPLAERGRTLRVSIAGTGQDWPRLRARVDALGLSGTVELPGFIPYSRIGEFYRGLDLFVIPRGDAAVAADTTPLKPLEALAAGLPLLSSELPALRELLAGQRAARFAAATAEDFAAAWIGFADRPWNGDAGGIAERSWRSEIRRYRDVYAAALRSVSPTLPAQQKIR